MRAVLAAAEQLAPVRASRVGIDETVMVTGRLTRRRRQFLTALVCLDTALVIAVTQGRDRASAARLLAEFAPDAQVVALDLFSGYKIAADALEDAVIVADVFHLVRVRREAPCLRGRVRDPTRQPVAAGRCSWRQPDPGGAGEGGGSPRPEIECIGALRALLVVASSK